MYVWMDACMHVITYIHIPPGWWFQPIIPTIGEDKKCSKPPTSHVACLDRSQEPKSGTCRGHPQGIHGHHWVVSGDLTLWKMAHYRWFQRINPFPFIIQTKTTPGYSRCLLLGGEGDGLFLGRRDYQWFKQFTTIYLLTIECIWHHLPENHHKII